MYIFIRSNDVSPDPRLQKYIDYAREYKLKYKIIAWNRLGLNIHKEHTVYYNRKAPFGRGIKNIPSKLAWFIFIVFSLIKHKNEYSIIHACDLDTAIPSYFCKKLLRKKMNFDVFDWTSSDKKKGINQLLVLIENFIFKNSDNVIICEKFRINQVQQNNRRDYMVLPNIPSINFIEDNTYKYYVNNLKKDYKLVLSYVGVFDKNRGIEDLLDFISEKPKIFLNIAGFGLLQQLVAEYSDKYPNINYVGKVDYNTGLNIMSNSDMIIGLYYMTNKVHKYAAPNKYYESLYLGVPLVTNEGPDFAKKIIEEETGFVIKEGKDGFKEISMISNEERLKKSQKARSCWESKYSDYTENFMKEYFEIKKRTDLNFNFNKVSYKTK
ncbi:glycosyltransferase [Sporosarcina sp. SAFN-015]|uniref:glycosyltransferase n=1 Tax=Sporosarcina sp. SAFN-015 TaxID=3387274 RepID=UPI003F7E039E